MITLVQVIPSIHISSCGLLGWLFFFKSCRSPIKRRHRPDMTKAVDWEAKPQLKQTKSNMRRLVCVLKPTLA